MVSIAAIEIKVQAPTLQTVFKVVTDLRTDFRGEKFEVDEVSYSQETVLPRSDMRVLL